LDEWNSRRTRIANRYSECLKGISELILPESGKPLEHTWHLYVVRCQRRAELISHLELNGIGSLVHYPIPPHLSKAYDSLGYKNGSLPVAETLANSVLSLPIGPHLTDMDVDRIIDCIQKFFGKF